MKLTLQIENISTLPDGGPTSYSTDGDAFEVGRDPAMDWTLPDDTRFISSRHLEVKFRGGAYWMTDCSTNGTYRLGEQSRINSPLQLHNGDRFQIGEYVVLITLAAEAQPAAAPPDFRAAAAPPMAPSAPQPPVAPMPGLGGAPGSGDPWSVGGPTPTPVAIDDVVPDARPRRDIFDGDFIETPAGSPVPSPAPGIGAPPSGLPPAAAAGPAAGSAGLAPSAPAAYPTSMPEAFLAQVCQGAGLPPDVFHGADTSQLGYEIGQVLRIAAENTMALLAARAAAKTSVKSGKRTMIGATDNSPLKFLPDATQALDAMFFHKRPGYMDGVAAFQDAFSDVKTHQAGVYAAIQPALARLLEDLSPEAIEERVGGGIMGSKKARAWETFVQRWDAKTHPYENGMLDVFLAYFAEAYEAAATKKG
ncbi:MAG: type VI secretion system-associated FHA domain protein TagH [Pseudomonadota bacterium]